MHGMVDPYLKIGRALSHLDALDELLKAFTGDKAYTIARYDDLENQRHVLQVKLLDVPDPICLTVGDAFYNMRSCLDQLVWSLAYRVGGILDPNNTQFPVIETDTPKLQERFMAQTKGVPDPAIDEILALQPYHRGDAYKAHPLWRLNAMCNLDKHRRIPANGSEAILNFPNIARGIVGVQHVGTHKIIDIPLDLRMDAFDDGYVLSVPLANKDKLQLNPSISFKVNFGGNVSGFSEDRVGIEDIYNFICDIVLPRFLRFFPKSK
jgi:hypothetical protein